MHLLFIVKEIDNEPQGILLISSVLKQAGHQVSLVVASEEDPVEAALRLQPDVVGYTVYTGPHTWYLELNQRIRAQLPGVFSIFGGPHPTFFPEMIEREGVDGLCIGEGEYATLDLMNALERNGGWLPRGALARSGHSQLVVQAQRRDRAQSTAPAADW